MLKALPLIPTLDKAIRLNAQNPKTAVFVTTLLRPREIKIATALRQIGWKVILLYKQTTPFEPSEHFDFALKLGDDRELHEVAKILQPRVCHVFSGAVDDTVLALCRDKPGPVIVDLNDVFAPSLFNYLQERFEPTSECLSLADGLVCRDLQPKFAEQLDGFSLPPNILLFPEYSWLNGPAQPGAASKLDPDEVHVVSVGTFTLESDKMYDSAYLQLSRMLTDAKIHLHIYPHWFYRNTQGSVFRFDMKKAFADFFALEAETPYLHMHESLPIEELALELPQYDFGIISGGSERLGQKLNFLTANYMGSCYSGRISDYLDARLPVLINPEVDFNFKLLNHYQIGVDLDQLFEPGFRDKLLALKRSEAVAKKVEAAADSMSLARNAARLGKFYERVMVGRTEIARFPLWLHGAMRLPVVGRRLAWLRDRAATVPVLNERVHRQQSEIKRLRKKRQQLTESASSLRVSLNKERADRLAQGQLVDGLRQEQEQLTASASSLRQSLDEAQADRLAQGQLVDGLRKEQEQLIASASSLRRSLEEAQTDHLAQERLMEGLRQEREQLIASASSLRQSQDKAQADRLAQEQLMESLRKEREQLIISASSLRQSLDEAQADSLAQERLMEGLRKEREQLTASASSLRQSQDKAQADRLAQERILYASLSNNYPDLTYSYPNLTMSKQEADELIGLLNWQELADVVERDQGFGELARMMRIFLTTGSEEGGGADVSAAWALLNQKNLDQLLRDGYRRFKRTIALNYFTFPIQEGDPQVAQVEALVDEDERAGLRQLAEALPDETDLAFDHQPIFRYHTLLLWAYARKLDTQGLVDRLQEPLEGSPISLTVDGKRISQDLANSLIEYYSMREGRALNTAKRVLEIGGGYGRDAFVTKCAQPNVQYVMLDVPPALYIAQRYLSTVFSKHEIFRVHEFESFEDVREEFESASIAFLLPHQLSLIPDKYFDLTVNISSFGEMKTKQIESYFSEIDRVTSQEFYTKQWLTSRNPFDGLVLHEKDYPVREHWKTIYSRSTAAQPAFFEALYDVSTP